MEEKEYIDSLVRDVQNGSRETFKKLFEQLHPLVFRTVYRLDGNRTSAEDITQETFVKIFKSIDDFDFKSDFSTWCYRIAVNTCYDHMRKQKRKNRYKRQMDTPEALVQREASPGPEKQLNQKEVNRLIEEKLHSLPGDLKTTFVLKTYERLSYRQIADIMQCKEGTVASRLSRARRRIADYLKQHGMDSQYLN